jgi:hypothetical protein
MTPLVVALLALPCVYWTEGTESKARLEAASITRICVAAGEVERWRAAGFAAMAITAAELAARETLPSPGVTARAGLASPTRAPWIVANGWRFTRSPGNRYVYDVPAGHGALAAAEAFAYHADAVLKIDPADLPAVGAMLTFLNGVPAADLPAIADLGIVDDGSGAAGEVMNLLARRNLLFKVVKTASPEFRINIALGTREYPLAEAADPSAFAQKIRRQLTDDQRSVRLYGSEVVICRVTGDVQRRRVHLLNYGGSDIEGLRIRLTGAYHLAAAYVAGAGRVDLQDQTIAHGATEFSIPHLAAYAVIDLDTAR